MSLRPLVKFLWHIGVLRMIDVVGGILGVHKRKIISMIDGGLASQMWEFSLGYAASRKANLPLYLDLTWFETSGCDILGEKNRPFNLFNAFPVIKSRYEQCVLNKSQISKWFTRCFSDWSRPEHSYVDYCPEDFTRISTYIGRYYTDVRYISPYREELSELFSFNCNLLPQEESIKQSILTSDSVALHIRRGDYVGSIHEVCTETYYQNSIKRMIESYPEAVFYIFTNDESWCQSFISKQSSGKYVLLKDRRESTPIVYMYLMSLCKHAIISNSGFSFMPAFLTYSDNKTVIMPDKWFGGNLSASSRYCFFMPGWIQLATE